MSKSEWTGKTALITGASFGIGEAFARELASTGTNLILTARSRERLDDLAEELTKRHRITVATLVADLTEAGAAGRIFADSSHLSNGVDLLINNAGFGLVGDFVDQPLIRQIEMIRVNVIALVELSHLFLGQMMERRSGAIINVASTASFQAVPYFAVYGATKAFVLSFSEALSVECQPSTVRVLALCPGPTKTHFQAVAGSTGRRGPNKMQTAEEVVRTALDALARGREHVVSGMSNRIMVQLERVIPRSIVARAAGLLYRQFSSRAQG